VVCLSVDRSVTILSPAETAELIEMPFRVWTRVGSRNHVLDGPDPLCRGAVLRGKSYLHGNGWLKEQESTFLLRLNPSFGETLDQVHFSCRELC